MRRAAVVIAAALLLDAAPAVAQNAEECRAALADASWNADVSDPCQVLSIRLGAMAQAVNDAFDRITMPEDINPATFFGERAFQAKNPQHAALDGTFAQAQAIPELRPAALATGSLAMLGSGAGSDALAAIGVNPAVLFVQDMASRAMARYSRLADVSVLLPVSSLTDGEADDDAEADDIDYVGVRIRMNALGPQNGDELWTRADSLVEAWADAVMDRTLRVRDLLGSAEDLRACATALREEQSDEEVELVCGGAVGFAFSDADALSLRDQLRAIRRTADAKYLGADVRMDFGDPTLGAVEDASGTFLFAGVAAGRRFDVADGGANYGLGARLGARHATLDATDGGELAVEASLGLELAREFEAQELNASAAIDARYGGADLEAAQTDFALFRASLVVPIAAGHNLSLAVGVPIDGEIESFLTVNFNWGLLLPDEPRLPF